MSVRQAPQYPGGRSRQRAIRALLLVIALLSMAALACNSDQEWIIPRTATPDPTATSVPITIDTAFSIGDSAVIVGESFQVWQTNIPEADNGRNRVIGTQCFPGQTTEVLDVAQGDDGAIYYYVHCILDGWVSEDNLEPVE